MVVGVFTVKLLFLEYVLSALFNAMIAFLCEFAVGESMLLVEAVLVITELPVADFIAVETLPNKFCAVEPIPGIAAKP